MEKLLSNVGSLLYGMRFTMLFFYAGLVAIIFGILGKFLVESYKLMHTLLFGDVAKIDLIIKVLELVDMTMVAQLVWVVALAGVSLFVTTGHFDSKDMKKPDWLDHVNTYNLKLKLAFAIISISGVHALKTYLSGDLTPDNVYAITMVAVIHFTFVLSAIGISFADRLSGVDPLNHDHRPRWPSGLARTASPLRHVTGEAARARPSSEKADGPTRSAYRQPDLVAPQEPGREWRVVAR